MSVPSPVDVSVIVATRNRASLLPACLASICAQRTAASVEVVVVDNDSQDATAEVVAEWSQGDPRVRLVAQPAIGLSRAKNAGIASARGDLLLFTDDDVLLAYGWIARSSSSSPASRRASSCWRAVPCFLSRTICPRGRHGSAPARPLTCRACTTATRRVRLAVGREHGCTQAALRASRRLRRVDRRQRRDRGTFEDIELVQRVAASGGECWYLPGAVLHHRTPPAAARPRELAGKAFNRGANDILRDRRGSHFEQSAPVPRSTAAAALAAPPLIAGWVLSTAVFRITRHPRAFELARWAWAAGWCMAALAAAPGAPARVLRALLLRGRVVALRLTPP